MSGIYASALLGDLVFIGTDNGISVTKDKGVTWKSVNKGLPSGNKQVEQLKIVGTTLFVTIHNKGAYVSNDNGESWTKLEGGLPKNPYVRYVIASGNTLFAAILMKGVYYSTDNGKTWLELNDGFSKKENVSTLLLDGNKLYAGVYDKGIYTYDVSKILIK